MLGMVVVAVLGERLVIAVTPKVAAAALTFRSLMPIVPLFAIVAGGGLWAAAGPYGLIARPIGVLLLVTCTIVVIVLASRHAIEGLAIWALAGTCSIRREINRVKRTKPQEAFTLGDISVPPLNCCHATKAIFDQKKKVIETPSDNGHNLYPSALLEVKGKVL